MDLTNISRYENPPEEAEYSALSQLNSKEDYLDVFVISLLHRSPIIYVLINITLLIWLAQTIISSKNQEIPKSAYLILPYLSLTPFKDILVSPKEGCPTEWQQIMLRTFPTIDQESFLHKQMYQWNADANITFCIKRVNPSLNLQDNTGKCNQNLISCSGYCFPDLSQCPITSINVIESDSMISPSKQVFYQTQRGLKFIYSKQHGRPIISLIATFQHRCSNDYHLKDEFRDTSEYEQTLTNCGNQGTINGFYEKITEMNTYDFMYLNNRGFNPTNSDLNVIELGSIYQIQFSNGEGRECNLVKKKAISIQSYISNERNQPLFKQSLLVIGFILMIAQLIWLMIYVCVNGYFNQKNIIAILICVIELTVITFIYVQNSKILETQQFIRSIACCIQNQVIASTTWNFGIQPSSVFTMIQYLGTIFLAHYFFAYLMDKLVFQPSSQIYRNFVYDDNDRSLAVQSAIMGH